MDTKINSIEIGKRIRTLRENMFMSRERFSENINISAIFLGQIERGESSLSLKTLSNIVSFTGVSADFILFGNDSGNSKVNKINRILKNIPSDSLDLIYSLINSVLIYTNKKSKKI